MNEAYDSLKAGAPGRTVLDPLTDLQTAGDGREGRMRWRTSAAAQWYGGDDRDGYIHRAWMRRGVAGRRVRRRGRRSRSRTPPPTSRPATCTSTRSPQAVKDGVYEAGGIPLNLPVVSLGETLVRPTAMLWRNMAAMAMEEMFRANPIDGLVLLGGCDKTIPSLLMAAASVDLPAVVVPGGPMLNGTFRGEPLGLRHRGLAAVRGGARRARSREEAFLASDTSMIRSKGHCNTMGTASTMAIMAEALGMTLPGIAGTPAPDSRLLEASHATGRLAVELVARGAARQRRHDRGVVPQRDRRARRDRRLDERGRAPARDRRAARHRR